MIAKVFGITRKSKILTSNKLSSVILTFLSKLISYSHNRNSVSGFGVIVLLMSCNFAMAKLNGISKEITQIKGSVNSNRGSVQSIKIIKESGGRVSWSPTGDKILFDHKNKDGFYDIYIMNSDGTDEKCDSLRW